MRLIPNASSVGGNAEKSSDNDGWFLKDFMFKAGGARLDSSWHPTDARIVFSTDHLI